LPNSAFCHASLTFPSRTICPGFGCTAGPSFGLHTVKQTTHLLQAMSLLYFKISWDYDFLVKAHEEVVKSDEFTKKMMQILSQIHHEGIKQKITLLTQRADYMCHVEEPQSRNFQLKQVPQLNHRILDLDFMQSLRLKSTTLR